MAQADAFVPGPRHTYHHRPGVLLLTPITHHEAPKAQGPPDGLLLLLCLGRAFQARRKRRGREQEEGAAERAVE